MDLSLSGQSRDAEGRHRAAHPGLGPWVGARVASPRCPILRPGPSSLLRAATHGQFTAVAPSNSATRLILTRWAYVKASIEQLFGSVSLSQGTSPTFLRAKWRLRWEPDGVSTGPLIGGTDEGSSERQGRGGSNLFREHGQPAHTTALGSRSGRDPVPAPSRSTSAPHAAPA
jgi:hypothetical protein